MRSEVSLLLKKYWGYDHFRGIQRDIIDSILAGHDTLGLMPTGGGKSVTFQVPALAMEGVCIVITPLIALMKDQVHHLRQLGINAAAIYSGQSHDNILRILENCILGATKLLYVSPERLGSRLFQDKLRHMHISFITVDEAHCISQWGYDFRPSYLEIAHIRTIANVPILALTATATPQVVEDICDKLSQGKGTTATHDFHVFRMSFVRPNLTYLVHHSDDKLGDLVSTLSGSSGSAIVYVRSRRHARETAEYLNEAGLSATYYHAGLDHAEKDRRQRDWQHDRVRIIVATNAFGMGIDKPDVRLVMHYDCPDSPEAYFQEAGRAGRDGQPAEAILLYNRSDSGKLVRRIGETFPPREYIRTVYEHLAYYYQIAVGDGYGVNHEFCIEEFCRRFHHFPVPVHSALQILDRAGYIDYTEEDDQQARVHFLVGRDDLYRLDGLSDHEERVVVALLRNYGGLFADFGYIDESIVAQQAGMTPHEAHDTLTSLSQRRLLQFIPSKRTPHIRYAQRREDAEHVRLPHEVYDDRLKQYRQRIQSMLDYAESTDRCRQRMLLEYFGERGTANCGRCDVCRQHEAGGADCDEACRQVLDMLSDHEPHPIVQLHQLALSAEQLDEAVSLLSREEKIRQQDGLLFLA